LFNERVLQGEVLGAGRAGGDAGGEGGHEARAGSYVGGAGVVEGLGYAHEGTLDLEERVGVLE